MSNMELEAEIHSLQQQTSKLMAERRMRAAAVRASDRQAKAALDAAVKTAPAVAASVGAIPED